MKCFGSEVSHFGEFKCLSGVLPCCCLNASEFAFSFFFFSLCVQRTFTTSDHNKLQLNTCLLCLVALHHLTCII